MLRFQLNYVFESRGIKQGYTFLRKIGISHSIAHRIAAGKVSSMSLGPIEKICEELNCTPNDLLAWSPNEKDLSQDHPLRSLRRDESMHVDILKEIEKLPLDKMQELRDQIRKLNNP